MSTIIVFLKIFMLVPVIALSCLFTLGVFTAICKMTDWCYEKCSNRKLADDKPNVIEDSDERPKTWDEDLMYYTFDDELNKVFLVTGYEMTHVGKVKEHYSKVPNEELRDKLVKRAKLKEEIDLILSNIYLDAFPNHDMTKALNPRFIVFRKGTATQVVGMSWEVCDLNDLKPEDNKELYERISQLKKLNNEIYLFQTKEKIDYIYDEISFFNERRTCRKEMNEITSDIKSQIDSIDKMLDSKAEESQIEDAMNDLNELYDRFLKYKEYIETYKVR